MPAAPRPPIGAPHLLTEQGQLADAYAHVEAALTVARLAGSRRGEGYWLVSLGRLDAERGRMDESCAHVEAALAVARDLGDRRLEGIVLGQLGSLNAELGRMDQAHIRYHEALAAARDLGDPGLEGAVLGGLGRLHADQGELDEALAFLTEGDHGREQHYIELGPQHLLSVLWREPAPFGPGSIDLDDTLGAPGEVAVLVGVDCRGDACDQVFHSVVGTLELTSGGTAGETLAGIATEVLLHETTVAADGTPGAWLDGGATWCLPEVAFDEVLAER